MTILSFALSVVHPTTGLVTKKLENVFLRIAMGPPLPGLLPAGKRKVKAKRSAARAAARQILPRRFSVRTAASLFPKTAVLPASSQMGIRVQRVERRRMAECLTAGTLPREDIRPEAALCRSSLIRWAVSTQKIRSAEFRLLIWQKWCRIIPSIICRSL